MEKQFPQFHRAGPFFPDAARARLNAAGIRVRTAAEFEREERALFDSAVTRATMLVTLSYPEFDARGERNLRSFYLEDWRYPEETARPVRPQPGSWAGGSACRPVRPAASARRRCWNSWPQDTRTLSPTALETYLHARSSISPARLLRLKTAPPRPEERLDFLTQGNIVHEVLAGWYAEPQDIAALLRGSLRAHAWRSSTSRSGYHTERLRNAMLDDLLASPRYDRWPRG